MSRDFTTVFQSYQDDGWMGGCLAFFKTVFQSYQDDGLIIMKCCVQNNFVYGWKDFRLDRGSNPGPPDQYQLALNLLSCRTQIK